MGSEPVFSGLIIEISCAFLKTLSNGQIRLQEADMAFRIDPETCTNCGVCDEECPVEAIKEKGDVRVIDPDICTDCGACEEVCPVGAIAPE